MQSEISRCETEFEEVRQMALANNGEIVHLNRQLDKLQQEESQLSADVSELSQVVQEEVNSFMLIITMHVVVTTSMQHVVTVNAHICRRLRKSDM